MVGPRSQGALVWSPFADEASALEAIETLLHEGLVACGNVLPGMTSAFLWQGKVERASEVGVLFKTNCVLLDRAVARLAEIHPYEEPAVLGWACDNGAPGTLEWLAGIAPESQPDT